jgi:hypothetical protein
MLWSRRGPVCLLKKGNYSVEFLIWNSRCHMISVISRSVSKLIFSLFSLFSKNKIWPMRSPCCVCVSVRFFVYPLPQKLLNAWINLYYTRCIYRGTRAHLKELKHKTLHQRYQHYSLSNCRGKSLILLERKYRSSWNLVCIYHATWGNVSGLHHKSLSSVIPTL